MTSPLRLGRIEYGNTLPLYGPRRGAPDDTQVVTGPPAVLNQELLAGHLDLAVISAVEFLRHQDQLVRPAPLGIAAAGPVRSVLLFSDVPLDELDGRDLTVTSHSASSVVMARILLARRGLRLRLKDYDHLRPLPEAPFLLIGDPALRIAQDRPTRFAYDLGELWNAEFGVPAVFAVLAARREVTATASGRARVAAVTRWMEENLEGFRSGLWELPRPIHRRVGLCAESFRSYLEGMTYRHGLPEEQGLERLREEATRLGLIEPAPSTRKFRKT